MLFKRKNIKSVVYFLLFIMVLLSGCGKKVNLNDPNVDFTLPTADTKNDILIYDRYNQKIVSYNLKNNKISGKNDDLNYMEYGFPNIESNVYTVGHSEYNKFKIVEIDNNKKIKTLLKMKKNEGIFPLAYRDYFNMFFLKSTYDKNNKEILKEKVICRYDIKSKKLLPIVETKGLNVSYGTIIKNSLFFTIYNEKTDSYNLMKYVLGTNERVQCIKKNLISEEIYNVNDKLFISNKKTIFLLNNIKVSFPKGDLNYFYKDNLIQFKINKNSDLELDVFDINNMKNVKKVNDPIDIQIVNNWIKVYTENGISNFKE
ncbi:MAG: hypothetical protein LBM02_06670 [Lachnospiraceae bacterium]|jgi:hypothetical protein|nr:hypothetical protein [Lachnospiraceae bacterium]